MSSYIGVEPATSFTGLIKQDFSVSATTSYTLSHSVNNSSDIALYINFVRQEPETAYSCSNTTLTLTSATAGSDDMYCIYLGQALQTVNPSNASVGNSQVAPSIITGQTNENTANDSDTILVYDDSATALRKQTRANFLLGVGGTNTPAFHVEKTDSNQSLSHNTVTLITFNNEEVDTNSAFASNTFTVPSGLGGAYFFYTNIYCESFTDYGYLTMRKNGTGTQVLNHTLYEGSTASQNISLSGIVNLSAGDYIRVYFNQTSGSSKNVEYTSDGRVTYFGGYKIIT